MVKDTHCVEAICLDDSELRHGYYSWLPDDLGMVGSYL
jgi:hypothetical protein